MKQLTLFFLIGVSVSVLQAQTITYPDRMYPSSRTAFPYGVASGDPLPTAVVIWTKRETADPSLTLNGQWRMARDSAFTDVVASGNYSTDSSVDFTVNIDVTGLSAGNVYYYRFTDGSGNLSDIGRTKTAVTGNVALLNLAVMSCSSVYSGYFNAYRRLGDRNTLDAVIHLGDYVYDFVDEDEEVRVPTPYPHIPQNLGEWRALQRYYLMDPDLRYARSRHPWIALWDNHDRGGDHQAADGDRAFREYLPIRRNNRTDNDSIFRNFSFGNLADIWITDVGSYRQADTFPDGSANLMGHVQLNELIDGLKTSSATWKIMGSQKMTGGWYTTGIDSVLLTLVPNNGPVFDNSSWDGYPETRNRLLDSLRVNHIDNFFALSGDAHISMAMDLVKDPYDSLAYDHATGQGSVGVEFLPSSISRGNLDEGGVPDFAIPVFVDISMGANPQHVYMDGVQHGYGLLEVRPDSIVATFCYSTILAVTQTETYKRMLVRKGENHWVRSVSQAAMKEPVFLPVSAPYPNPTSHQICFDFGELPPPSLQLNIYSVGTGHKLHSAVSLPQNVRVSVEGWAKGLYAIQLVDGNRVKHFKFVVE